MGARNLTNQQFTLARDLVALFGRCVGAAGANPTGLKGLGISSITWVSTGIYDIVLTDKWNALVDISFSVIDSTGLRHYTFNVKTETVSTTKTIRINVFAAATTVAPTLADLATTDTLIMKFVVSNSKQVPTGYS